ncbi:helix-turn-helix domain-containing protein [Arcobacter sp. FWKO B]|uniref:helix-turn-helix domain-containing protein n=1 Tax=Arcobacter sp. FWKO B TaxID=2593672 RepID=UPI001D19575D|nr:helix-turn-helix transcriptional regulator [Arcobacter sp. FWKO B]
MKYLFSSEEIDDLHKRVGQKVKYYRTKCGLTQLDLSLEMGCKSVSLISAAELYTNKKHFNIEHLYKISKILNIPMEAFFVDKVII